LDAATSFVFSVDTKRAKSRVSDGFFVSFDLQFGTKLTEEQADRTKWNMANSNQASPNGRIAGGNRVEMSGIPRCHEIVASEDAVFIESETSPRSSMLRRMGEKLC